MEIVILAGGFGTRLSEYTKKIPKPMVGVSKYPLLMHIILFYSKYNYSNFVIAGGYKANIINEYFKNKSRIVKITKNYREYNYKFTFNKKKYDLNIKVVHTGKNTMTGGRLKRLSKVIKSNTFMMTYGDGLSDVNLKSLLRLHKKMNKIATVTAVRPPARFGYLNIANNLVSKFSEKKQTDEGWINGGFFIFKKQIFNYIKNDSTFLEKEPLTNLAKKSELSVFKHRGFWACVDTKRDLDTIKQIFSQTKFESPWLI